MFGIFKKKVSEALGAGWKRQWNPHGLSLQSCAENADLTDEILTGFLGQLQDDGYASETSEGVFIDWDSLFAALPLPGYADLAAVLKLPTFTEATPVLQSSHSLIDPQFSILLAGWIDRQGRERDYRMQGAVLADDAGIELMRPEQWALIREVQAFARRPDEDRQELANRQAWGRIRKLAQQAGARLDDFLYRSIVLTPDKLEVKLRKSEGVADDKVVEIAPNFAGAPAAWLDRFDSARQVLDRYDVATEEGIVQILITPAVRTVLQEIKKMPGRRVAGARAQAFILNPYAALGEDAKEVLDEDQFNRARDQAGLRYEHFLPVVEKDESGYPSRVGLFITVASGAVLVQPETRWLNDDELAGFVDKFETCLARNYQLLAWDGYDFEIQGDAKEHLTVLKAALAARMQPPLLISYDQVHDLSMYSSRIEGIGTEKPYYSPYIAKKKDDEGWFPENVVPVIAYTPEGESGPVAVPATKDALEQLKKAAEHARNEGKSAFSVPWLPKPMPLKEAESLLSTFENVLEKVQNKTFDPDNAKQTKTTKPPPRVSLIIGSNIHSVDYEERRREALRAVPDDPELPVSLAPGYALLEHQCEGLAWLQHLYQAKDEFQVRGAVLADDMGLGKTFQLLAFMAWLLERAPDTAPMLVVAPVSLLENWKEEAGKFFLPGALPILTAYGDALKALRVPRERIDARLRNEEGLVHFLKPDWVGGAKIVLTTYETLRDLEFSFAAQPWAMMVCDEAQRIKNPAAMVTRAAKKQNVGFKIACTGTPVENTLADLWCLFDFVQPGLLGALDDFGRRYRKPIEAKSTEEKSRVEELRARISSQILRRTKAEVAKDLPRKIEVPDCRKLPLSSIQRNLYAKAIEDFKNRDTAGHASAFKNHLGLLHYLRLVCTDPVRHGLSVFKPEPVDQYRAKAPKLDWLLDCLESIRARQEKAIVFCEFRNIQRLLQHYIAKSFALTPEIINGDTSAAADSAASRQKRIKAFQQKDGFNVIILSPVAVGFGVNIQGANHVIHYTRTWNPAKEDQATDRAYRIGQKKDVYVYYPVVHAEDFLTFDVKLDHLLTHKRALASDMLNGAGDVSLSDFAMSELVPRDLSHDIDERVDLDTALKMEWRHFEGLAAVLWRKMGFELSYCTPAANDNGIDVVAISGAKGVLVQTKTSASEGVRLGWDTVKELLGGEAFYRNRHPGIEFKKVGLTNQYFNAQAHENARLNNVELIEQPVLRDLLERHEVTMLDIEKVLYTEWSYEHVMTE